MSSAACSRHTGELVALDRNGYMRRLPGGKYFLSMIVELRTFWHVLHFTAR